jgi:two-component system response regulator FixJ
MGMIPGPLPPPAVPQLLAAAREATARMARLSAREQDVLRGIAAGMLTKQIAHALDVSPRTVETQRYAMGRKLGTNSLTVASRIDLLARLAPTLEAMAAALAERPAP